MRPRAALDRARDNVAPEAAAHVPQMLLATAVVVLLPLATSLILRATGVLSSAWLSVALTVGLSLTASYGGSAYWRKRDDAGELLFSELLVWGWIRRWRHDREVANAAELLELGVSARADRTNTLSTERREELLRGLAKALEGQDVYLNGHSRRVARHAAMIARGLGLSSEEVARIRAAAAVHDVGKLLTPKTILNKPGRLTDGEFDVVKRHPVDSAEMVAALGDPELTRIVRHHHERLDGAGYPDGLSSEQIPLGARIIAVADTFDAITSSRPYRAAARHQRAIDILRTEAGSQLDPAAVRAFLAYYSGRRPTAVWALAAASARRIVSGLSGNPAGAATISATKLAAATAATVAIGAAGGGLPIPAVRASAPRNVAHAAALAHQSTGTRGGSLSPPVSALRASGPTRKARARPGRAQPGNTHAASKHTKAPSGPAADAARLARHTPVAAPAQSAPVATPSQAKPSPATPAAAATTPATTPATTTSTVSVPTTSAPAPPAQPVATNRSGQQGNGHAHGQGNGRGQGNVSVTTAPATSPATSPVGSPIPVQVTTPTQTATATQSQGNANGNGNGGGNGNGNAYGQGKGNAAGTDQGKGTG